MTSGVLQVGRNSRIQGEQAFEEHKKTGWISMLSPCKRIFTKYKLLVVKMAKDNGHIENAKNDLLCDVETLPRFACILPCLETMQGISKFAQRWTPSFVISFLPYSL
jgi:hypothetical protein